MKKNLISVAALFAASALLLTGCSAGNDAKPSPTPNDSAIMEPSESPTAVAQAKMTSEQEALWAQVEEATRNSYNSGVWIEGTTNYNGVSVDDFYMDMSGDNTIRLVETCSPDIKGIDIIDNGKAYLALERASVYANDIWTDAESTRVATAYASNSSSLLTVYDDNTYILRTFSTNHTLKKAVIGAIQAGDKAQIMKLILDGKSYGDAGVPEGLEWESFASVRYGHSLSDYKDVKGLTQESILKLMNDFKTTFTEKERESFNPISNDGPVELAGAYDFVNKQFVYMGYWTGDNDTDLFKDLNKKPYAKQC